MLYTTFTAGGAEYKCRLNAKACVDLEKRLGKNPINIFSEIQKTNQIPLLEDMIAILHASLQTLEHSISLDKTYEIYDAFVDDGNTLQDLMPILIEIFKVSGFFKEDNTKN